MLYRVLQEGLTNTVRHAGAGSVHARLTYEPDRVVLVVGDDGHGAHAPPGFGLTALSERAEAIGGGLRTRNVDGGGFELRAELPAAAP